MKAYAHTKFWDQRLQRHEFIALQILRVSWVTWSNAGKGNKGKNKNMTKQKAVSKTVGNRNVWSETASEISPFVQWLNTFKTEISHFKVVTLWECYTPNTCNHTHFF